MVIENLQIEPRIRTRPIRSVARIALVLCSLTSCAFAQAADSPNLVPNGDFSAVTAGKPDQWETFGNPKDVDMVLKPAQDDAGKPCVELICTRCDAQGGSSHAMLCENGAVALHAGRTYEFSCRMRAEDLQSRAVTISLQDTRGWQPTGLSRQLPLGKTWKRYRVEFRAQRDVGPTGRLQFSFAETGTLWISDVRIIEMPSREVERTDLIPDIGAKNLLCNGAFEVGTSCWSSLGISGAGGRGRNLSGLHGVLEASGGTQGRSFLRIPLGGERTPVISYDYFDPTVRRELRPLAVNLGWMPVVKGTPYTLSCDMRASKEGVRAVLAARAEGSGGGTRAMFVARSGAPVGGGRDYTRNVILTTDWQRYSFTFTPEQPYIFVMVGPDLVQEDRVDVDVDAVQLEKGDQATPWTPRTLVEFAIEPSQPAGIFTAGERASLVLRAANYSETAVRAPVRFTVTDFDDRAAALPDASLSIPPHSSVQSEVQLPADWKGYYRVRAALLLEGGPQLSDLRVAVVPKRTSNDSVCGINHAFCMDWLIDLASKAGVTWYRDWSLKWEQIEPVKGQFHWEVGDPQIDRVLREGCHVLPLLPPFPSAEWSSSAPADLPRIGLLGEREREAFAPKDPDDLADFVGKAVARYKDRVHVYEFLNEPIFTGYALPDDHYGRYRGLKYAPADYVALLAAASAGMKRADPACKVIGGIAGGPALYTREAIEAGCLKHADYFNLHVYPELTSPEGLIPGMDKLLALMDANGGRKQIWLTEFSYNGADDPTRRPFTVSRELVEAGQLNERQCAQLTVRFFAVMLSHGVEKIFIHSGASATANGPQFGCPIFAYAGAPRRLFPAMAVLTELLGAKPTSSGYRRLGDTDHAAAFEAGQRSLLIAWEEEEGPNSALSGIPDGIRCLDMMGREIAVRPVKLSASAVYLLGAPGRASELLDALAVVP